MNRSLHRSALLCALFLFRPIVAEPNSQLLNGAFKGDVSAIRQAIQSGADINYRSPKGHTALLFAVHSNCKKCVELLIEKKANPNLAAKANNETPLMKAISEEKYDIAIILLKGGANPETVPEGGMPPLVYAMDAGNETLIRSLLAAGANPNFATQDGNSLLHRLAREKNRQLLQLFLENGAYPDPQTAEGTTPLMIVSQNGCIKCVALLLEAGADPSLKNQKGAAAKDFAKSAHRQKILELLDPEQSEAASVGPDRAILFLTLIDMLKIPDAGVLCTIEDKKRHHSIQGRTDSKGQIKDVVYKGGSYTLTCDKFGQHVQFDTTMEIAKTKEPLVHREVLQITVTIRPPKSYELKGINFAFDRDRVVPDPNQTLDHLVDVMKENKNMEIQISGHTDGIGNEPYNIDLSRRRAVNVMNYLIKRGIAARRLSAKGYGPSKPIATNKTAAGRARNRRIMVDVIKE